MKLINQLALVFSLSIFATSANSQSYTPLLNTINEWHFTTCFSGCLADIYWTDGETTVDGKTYKILDGFHYISRTFLIREDVATRKVYMLIHNPPSKSDEVLLYDFSILPGDTMEMSNPISPYPENPGKFICDSIVSRQLVDSNYYKYFYFHPIDTVQASSNSAIWVEGVGSLSLINCPGGEPDLNNVGHLTCFFKDTQSHYQKSTDHPICQATKLPTGIQDVPKMPLKTTYNSSSNTLELTTMSTPYTLKIFTIHGQQLGATIQISSSQKNIYLGRFPRGIILLQVEDSFGNRNVIKTVIP